MQMTRTNIVFVGHIDHGKSTTIGRLLADTNSLPIGKLEQVADFCRRKEEQIEYAYLADSLRDERSQGITIDSSRSFANIDGRPYALIDAPGHLEFLRNFVSGASRADAAVLVVDAFEGLRENTRRHGYLLSLLGVARVLVLVNKMDLVSYNESRFLAAVSELKVFLRTLGIIPDCFIPVAAREGANIVDRSGKMRWYDGPTLVGALNSLAPKPTLSDFPVRMNVQDIYNFDEHGDKRQIVAATLLTGKIHVGDNLVFYPSGAKATVATFEAFNTSRKASAEAGESIGITLSPQRHIGRGEVAALAREITPLSVGTSLHAAIFWLGNRPLVANRVYALKIGSMKVPCELVLVNRVIDMADAAMLTNSDDVQQHQAADITLRVHSPIAFDTAEFLHLTSRFVLVDDYEIAGGGTIRGLVRNESP
jgi:bifunctional enzyme CysN/CysC